MRGSHRDRGTCLRACTRARGRRTRRRLRGARRRGGDRFHDGTRPPPRSPRPHERRTCPSRDRESIGRRADKAWRLCTPRRCRRGIRRSCACMRLRRCTPRDNPGRLPLDSSVRQSRPALFRPAARTKRAIVDDTARGAGTPLRVSTPQRSPRTCRARTACTPRPFCSARSRGNPWRSWPRSARDPGRRRGGTPLALCTRRTRRSSSPSRRSTPTLGRPRAWSSFRRGPARDTKARSCSVCSNRKESRPCPPRCETFGTRSRASRPSPRAGRRAPRHARVDRPHGEVARIAWWCVAGRGSSRGVHVSRKARVSTCTQVEPSPHGAIGRY
jgi:hypothetical protein